MSKLLLLDLDGSMVTKDNRNETHVDNFKYLKLIKGLGFEVGICTGRPKFGTMKLAEELDVEPMITMGGSFVTYKNNILIKETINLDEEVDHLKEVFGSDAYIGAMSEECMEHINEGFIDGASKFSEFKVGRVNEPLQISVMPRTKLKEASIEFVENYQGVNFDMFYWDMEDSVFIEMHKKGVSKWSGLKKIMEVSNFEKEDIYFLGDGINDVDMMDNLTNTFAPINSHPKVLKRAKHILKHDSSQPLLKDIYEIIIAE